MTSNNGSGLLISNPEFERLLRLAAMAHGTPKNIDEWAKRIAADVSTLAD